MHIPAACPIRAVASSVELLDDVEGPSNSPSQRPELSGNGVLCEGSEPLDWSDQNSADQTDRPRDTIRILLPSEYSICAVVFHDGRYAAAEIGPQSQCKPCVAIVPRGLLCPDRSQPLPLIH